MNHSYFLHLLMQDPLSQILGLEEQWVVSESIAQSLVQDPLRYRARCLGLNIASLLIDESAELSFKVLEDLLSLFGRTPFFLAPEREDDALIYGHLRDCLEKLKEDPEIWRFLKKFSPPVCHKGAEALLYETLAQKGPFKIETFHIRRAALCSWLTFLRQSTGSCFATAPAILIQQKSPLQFLKDLYDLLTTGQLKRVYEQKQYSAPLITTFSSIDLKKRVDHPFFGLCFALESVGVLWSEKKKERLLEWGKLSVEEILRRLLLEEMGLDEKDLKDEEIFQKNQMSLFFAKQQGVYYQRPGPKSGAISEWKKKLEGALFAFRSLTDCALLRSWEYTLASFSDVKTEFSRWNLYTGLGLHPEEKEGVGSFLYTHLQKLLQKTEQEMILFQKEYEEQAAISRGLDAMMQRDSDPMRRSQIHAELQRSAGSLPLLLEKIEKKRRKAEEISQSFPQILEFLDQKFQSFFQEVFDPALISEKEHLYEDSPAGFRLVYKHGREDASLWTSIYTQEQYVESLTEFFSMIEPDFMFFQSIEKEEISALVTALIQFVQSPSFMEASIKRAKKRGRSSPWDYISGGTLQALLMVYFQKRVPFQEKSITPFSEEELFSFLAQIEEKRPLLMHSPTHAFLFHRDFFSTGLKEKSLKRQEYNEEMQEVLAHKLATRLPEPEKRALFFQRFRNRSSSFSKESLKQALESSLEGIKEKKALVESLFFENFQLLSREEAQRALSEILPSSSFDLKMNYWGSIDLYHFAKQERIRKSKALFHAEDLDAWLAEKMRDMDLFPEVARFADTNWSGWLFCFLKHQETSSLELWRCNRTATRGVPMLDWKQWFGEKNEIPWVVLTNPEEYTLK